MPLQSFKTAIYREIALELMRQGRTIQETANILEVAEGVTRQYMKGTWGKTIRSVDIVSILSATRIIFKEQ